jgi:hypothetical protein
MRGGDDAVVDAQYSGHPCKRRDISVIRCVQRFGLLVLSSQIFMLLANEETSSPESADTGRSGNNLKRRSLGSHHCGSAYPWRKNAGTSSIASTPYLAGVSGQLPTRSVRSWDFHPAPWPVARSVLVVALALNGLGVSLRTREDGWTAPVDPTPTILRSSSPPTTFTSSTLTFRVLLIRSETQGIDLYERISRSSPAYLDTC